MNIASELPSERTQGLESGFHSSFAIKRLAVALKMGECTRNISVCFREWLRFKLGHKGLSTSGFEATFGQNKNSIQRCDLSLEQYCSCHGAGQHTAVCCNL